MAKGKHKNRRERRANAAEMEKATTKPAPTSSTTVRIPPQDDFTRQINRWCDEEFNRLEKHMRKTCMPNASRSKTQQFSSPDFFDCDPDRLSWKKRGTAKVAGKLKERLGDLYNELEKDVHIEKEWIHYNAFPVPTYDSMDEQCSVHTGAVIWILDQIKKVKKTKELIQILPDRRVLDDVDMPDIWDASFSEDILLGASHIVQNRNNDCTIGKTGVRFGDWLDEMKQARKAEDRHEYEMMRKRLAEEGKLNEDVYPELSPLPQGKYLPYEEVARRAKPYPYRDLRVINRNMLDEITADGLQHQDVPSRQHFEDLLSLVPQEAIDEAVQNCENRIWDWIERFFKCRQVFAKRENALYDKIEELGRDLEQQIIDLTGFTMKQINEYTSRGGLSYLMSKKGLNGFNGFRSLEGATSGTKGNAPVLSPLANPSVAMMMPSASPLSNIAPRGGLGGIPAMPGCFGGEENVLDKVSRMLSVCRKQEEALVEHLEEQKEEVTQFVARICTMNGSFKQENLSQFGEEIEAIMSGIPTCDPYEVCFAFLYMIDRDHELMSCYFSGSSILNSAKMLLPWAGVEYSQEDDPIWRWDDEILDDEPVTKRKVIEPDMPDWYEQKYTPEDMFGVVPYNLAQVFYEQTGVVIPRDMKQYYSMLHELARFGITGKKMTLPLLIGMTIAGNARHQTQDWRPLFEDSNDVSAGDVSTENDAGELKEKLAAAKKEIERLNRALHASDSKAREAQKQIEAQGKQNESQRQELADLRELLFNYDEEKEEAAEAEEKYSFPYTVEHRTLVFGGHASFLREIKPRLPNVRFVDKDAVPDLNLIRNAEIIWVQTNCISHKQYNRMLDVARMKNIPVRYFAYASSGKCAAQVCESDREL